jgi:hypothetical protein
MTETDPPNEGTVDLFFEEKPKLEFAIGRYLKTSTCASFPQPYEVTFFLIYFNFFFVCIASLS